MGLSRAEVEHIAELVKLALTEEEKEVFALQLSSILEHFQALQALDTTGISPTAQVIALKNVMRADEVTPSLSLEEALANAPQAEKGYFKVPAVL
ncbi:MAG: Asp-tRNA(Asn)/Glu-tRNA(Gln) amidotransferase subunit GatC [Anaerolineae bacterium]|nr:Asp-tRNA(Asn)/Glu-tRNA(Gln) amidotransferase subunit GatC [Anaerolineae bacterium]